MRRHHFRPMFRSASGSQGPSENSKEKSKRHILSFTSPSIDRRNLSRNACFGLKNIPLKHVASTSFSSSRNITGEKKLSYERNRVFFFKAAQPLPIKESHASLVAFPSRSWACASSHPQPVHHPPHMAGLRTSAGSKNKLRQFSN